MEKRNKVISKHLQKRLNELVRNKQYDEAAKLLEPIARKGNADTQYKMGKLLYYRMIDQVEAEFKDYSKWGKAIFWSELSSKPELCKTDFSDVNKMIEWYEKAAKEGYTKAMVELAQWYTPVFCTSSAESKVIKQSPFFTLKCDLKQTLSWYMRALEAGNDDFFMMLAGNLLHSPHVPPKMKNRVVKKLCDKTKEGNWQATKLIFNIIEVQHRFPEKEPSSDIQIDEHELLHSDWFQLLLSHEIECEKKEEYCGKDALRQLSDLADNGNQDALDMLTNIGMQTGGLPARWAGDIHYKRHEYEMALKCYQRGKAHRMLAQMYERGEGTTIDVEKAFHYYTEAEDYYNMGRMYEQGIGTEKNLQKAFECYHKIVHKKIYTFDSEEEKQKIMSVRCSFRRLKKILFAQKDEIRITVVTNEPKPVCNFSFLSYGDCLITIDWDDGQVEEINNHKGEKIHAEHTYAKEGEWNIYLRSDETHTLISFHYTCEICTLKTLDVTQCPILIDLYCINQELKSLDVSKNPRLERLVCRGNKLSTLNIRKNNRLTQLDCSDNPLRHLDWHPRYSALSKVCMKNTLNLDQITSLSILLKSNKGKKCKGITETQLESVFLPLSYYMRCLNWSEVKAKIKEGKYPIIVRHSLAKYKSAFDDMCSRKDFCYTGIDRIVCEGGYTYYWLYSRREKEYVRQDLEDVLMNSTPWSETLDMPVEIREYEGWMMLPQVTCTDVFCACFTEMTYSHWKETEEIVQKEREFWKRLRQRQKKYG